MGALWGVPGGRAPLLETGKEIELVSRLKRLRERHQEGGFLYRRLRETGIKRLWGRNISFGLHNGNLIYLVGRARPVYLLGWDLYLIYFSVMCNLEVCGLVFDHKTLRDISVWALRRWVSGSRHFVTCLYRESAKSCLFCFLKAHFNLALCTQFFRVIFFIQASHWNHACISRPHTCYILRLPYSLLFYRIFVRSTNHEAPHYVASPPPIILFLLPS